VEEEFFSIKHWNEDDRPREKMLLKGRHALSDAELIAILIRTGSRNESAVALSQRILSASHNNLIELGRRSISELMSFHGVGRVKAVTIAAALELGRRRREAEALDREKISGSASVFEYLHPSLGDLTHEEFWVLFLTNSNRVIKKMQLSKGGITGTLVDVRLVYREALLLNAVAVILAHNHPSGNLKPSRADIELTKKMKAAGEKLDIKILDHLIITEKAYFSFADENLL